MFRLSVLLPTVAVKTTGPFLRLPRSLGCPRSNRTASFVTARSTIYTPKYARYFWLTSGFTAGVYYLTNHHDYTAGSSSSSSSSSSSLSNTNEKDTNTVNDEHLPIYTNADVAQHNSIDKRVWISYHGYVYDITDFITLHPGGNKILLGAGNDIEVYWNFYQQHRKPYVQEVLAQYRIGRLDSVSIQQNQEKALKNSIDPYINDPVRDPSLIIRSLRPFNGETPNEILTDEYLTPQNVLFTRNHLPVPEINIDKYRLVIEGIPVKSTSVTKSTNSNHRAKDGEKQSLASFWNMATNNKNANNDNTKDTNDTNPSSSSTSVSFSLADLQDSSRFSSHTVTSVLQCAGNRRADMSRAKPSRGLDWKVGAIGNGEWTGVPLREVLLSLGIQDDDIGKPGLAHVRFEGLDTEPNSTSGYGASIPLDIAMDKKRNVLLAWDYNHEPLTKDHGAPLRVIVPGVVAARQVKWLGKIILSSEESETVWQRKDYKAFPQYQDWDTVDFNSMPAIQDMPVSSGITEPVENKVINVSDGETSVKVKGWAWSGGGRAITRVDVSPDNGQSWVPAKIIAKPEDKSPSLTSSWGWTLWEANVPVPIATEFLLAERRAVAKAVAARLVLPPGAPLPASLEPVKMEIVVKAMDSACNTQPESPLPIWNYRGVVNNSWSRVKIQLQ